MRYLVLSFRAEDTVECEIYWTDDYEDAMDIGGGAEYHSFTIIEGGTVSHHLVEEG